MADASSAHLESEEYLTPPETHGLNTFGSRRHSTASATVSIPPLGEQKDDGRALEMETQEAPQRAVHWDKKTDTQEPASIIPTLSSAVRHAKRAAMMHEQLIRKREQWLTARSELTYQYSIWKANKGFVQESVDTLATLLANSGSLQQWDTVTTPQHVEELLLQTRNDLNTMQRHEQKFEQYQDDVKRLESEVQKLEEEFFASSLTFTKDVAALNLIVEDESDDGRPESVASSYSNTGRDPDAVEEYFDKLGNLRIYYERLVDIKVSHDDDLMQREVLVEQDRPLSPRTIRESDEAYQKDYDEALVNFEDARNALEIAYQKCTAAGYDPEDYRSSPPASVATDDSSDEIKVRPVPVATLASTAQMGPMNALTRLELIDELNDQAQSQRGPVFGAVERVYNWRSNIADADGDPLAGLDTATIDNLNVAAPAAPALAPCTDRVDSGLDSSQDREPSSLAHTMVAHQEGSPSQSVLDTSAVATVSPGQNLEVQDHFAEPTSPASNNSMLMPRSAKHRNSFDSRNDSMMDSSSAHSPVSPSASTSAVYGTPTETGNEALSRLRKREPMSSIVEDETFTTFRIPVAVPVTSQAQPTLPTEQHVIIPEVFISQPNHYEQQPDREDNIAMEERGDP